MGARLLAVAFCAELGYAVLNLSVMPVYLRDTRGFGEAAIGVVLATFLGVEALAKSFTGAWARRFGEITLVRYGPALSVISIALTLFVPLWGGTALEIALLAFLRALDGFGAALVWPSLFAAASGAVPPERRPAVLSRLNGAYLVGIALAFPLSGWLDDRTGHHRSGLYLAAAAFLAAVLLTPLGAGAREDVGPGDAVGPLRELWRADPRLPLIGFLAFAGVGFPTFVAKLFPMDEFRLSESQVGLIVLPAAAVMALAAGGAGRVAARFGRRRAVAGGLLTCALGMSALATAAVVPPLRQAWLLGTVAPVVALGFLVALPAWYAYVGGEEASPRRLGAVMAAQGFGAIVAAPLGAAMYEKLRPLGRTLGLGASFAHWSPFIGSCLCLSLATFLAASLRERR